MLRRKPKAGMMAGPSGKYLHGRGPVLDVPETPESQARIASLRKRIAELNEQATKGSGPVQEALQQASHPIGAQPLPDEQTVAG